MDQKILSYVAHAYEVWHAGDIGKVSVLDQLESIKPLKAVYGNIDSHSIRLQAPEVLSFSCEGVSVLMLHIAEEYAFDFGGRIAGITEGIWSTEMFLWSLGLGFPLVWISGGIAIAKRHPFGGFASCFLFCGMLLGEPTHLLIFPIREMLIHGGHYDYFPGMWTALMPLVSGLWGLVVIVQDSRQQKLGAATENLKEAGTQTP